MEELFEDMKRKGLITESCDWIIKAIEQHKVNDLSLANSCLLRPYDQIDRYLVQHGNWN